MIAMIPGVAALASSARSCSETADATSAIPAAVIAAPSANKNAYITPVPCHRSDVWRPSFSHHFVHAAEIAQAIISKIATMV
jgi:hypothetical protein